MKICLAFALAAVALLIPTSNDAQVDVFGGDRLPYVGVAVSPTITGRTAEVFVLARDGHVCFILVGDTDAISCIH